MPCEVSECHFLSFLPSVFLGQRSVQELESSGDLYHKQRRSQRLVASDFYVPSSSSSSSAPRDSDRRGYPLPSIQGRPQSFLQPPLQGGLPRRPQAWTSTPLARGTQAQTLQGLEDLSTSHRPPDPLRVDGLGRVDISGPRCICGSRHFVFGGEDAPLTVSHPMDVEPELIFNPEDGSVRRGGGGSSGGGASAYTFTRPIDRLSTELPLADRPDATPPVSSRVVSAAGSTSRVFAPAGTFPTGWGATATLGGPVPLSPRAADPLFPDASPSSFVDFSSSSTASGSTSVYRSSFSTGGSPDPFAGWSSFSTPSPSSDANRPNLVSLSPDYEEKQATPPQRSRPSDGQQVLPTAAPPVSGPQDEVDSDDFGGGFMGSLPFGCIDLDQDPLHVYQAYLPLPNPEAF